MRQAISASGARYVDPEDETTSFWNKGNTAQLTIKDKAWPLCVAAGTLAEPFTARGNEPFWSLTLEDSNFRFDRLGSEQYISGNYVQHKQGDDVFIELDGSNQLTAVRVSRQLCYDSMSGMVYPYSVKVMLPDKTLGGCGGNPKHLLQGEQWRVVTLGGAPVATDSEMTVNFVDDALVAGSTSCNWYSGQYHLKGDGLEISKLASTRRACMPSLMAQEAAFLKQLAEVDRFDFDERGQLVLLSGDIPVAVARKSGY